MRALIAILALCLTANLQAGKPTNPEPDPAGGFVGYSTGLLTGGSAGILIEGSELCRETFGVNATIATSRDIRAAIDNGTFSQPTNYGVFIPSDTVKSGGDSYVFSYDPHININYRNQYNQTLVDVISIIGTTFYWTHIPLSSTTPYHIACSTA